MLACLRASARLLSEQRALGPVCNKALPAPQARWMRISRGLLDEVVNKGGDSGSSRGSNELVDPHTDARLKELFAIPIKKPLIPGGIPQFVRIADEPLIKQLKELDGLGGTLQVAAFLRRNPDAEYWPPTGASAPAAAAAASEDEEDASETSGGATREGEGEEAPQRLSGLSSDDLHEVGTIGIVKAFSVSTVEGEEIVQLGIQGHRRIRRVATLSRAPLKVQCQPIRDEPFNKEDAGVRATHAELVATMKQIFELQPLYLEQLRHVRHGDFQDHARFADLVVSLVNGTAEDCQSFLEDPSVPSRLMRALAILKKELDLINLQKDISRRVEEKFSREQKRYFLMEQLKHIQKELGITKDEKGAVIQKFVDRFEPRREAAPEEVRQAVEEEIGKLRVLEPASSEYNVTRNYLDWLTSIPWGVFDPERFDIAFARECLDNDHYGLDDVKDRILEFIAVGKLNAQVQGKILCMVGPPGVGKTSIGKSIANALGRKFFRFSVGGLSDVAEIKGHRRTYVGAMPGKLVQCLKQVQSSNPMVLIDEIDKLGRGMQGDPASALLELLDPEQNGAFRDHYLDVPLDLSKTLFVCTANVLDTIPRPLLDRMEVIEVSGYTSFEKRHIARNYLEPEVRRACAIPEGAVELGDTALGVIIEQYCRESGVRNLKKQLEKVYRKIALRLATSEELEIVEEEVEEEEGAESGGSAQQPAVSTSAAPPVAEVAGGALAGSGGDGSAPESLGASSDSDSSSARSTDPDTGESSGTLNDSPGAEADKQKKKTTRKVAIWHGETIRVEEGNISDYLGKAPHDSDRFYDSTPAGVVMGLAWTSMGGSTLYVESSRVSTSGEPKLTVTGQLGDVMKESVTIAQTFARHVAAALDPGNRTLEEGSIHLHVPHGATPKDGPSAGCTAVTALLSLAFGTPVLPDSAMTGEISLSGRLLPIGGVKEKTLAAKRSGVKTVLFPEANRRDWDELGQELKEGLDVHFPAHYVDMIPILFPGLADRYQTELTALRDTLIWSDRSGNAG